MRFLLFFLMAAVASAQTPATPAPNTPATPAPVPANRPVWRCNTPAGFYEVVVSAIVSVSSHEYMVDGVARVTEVNVDTHGSVAVRFYCIEPIVTSGPNGIGAASAAKVQGMLAEAADRSGTDVWRKVVKSYPATTHARTVEFRVGDKETLTKILNSASKTLRTGVPDEFTVSK